MRFASIVKKKKNATICGIACASFSCMAILSACGDNITTENITQVTLPGMEIASDLTALPDCDSSSNGVQVWVKSEATSFVCADNEWFRVKSDAPEYSCATETLADDSGVKIVCEGDSVGVLLNGSQGKTGANGKNASASCSAKRIDGTSFIQISCEKDALIFDLERYPEESSSSEILSSSFEPESSSSEPESSSSEIESSSEAESSSSEIEISSSSELPPSCSSEMESSSSEPESSSSEESSSSFDEEAIQTSLDSMSGFSQKGPFVMGSNVRLYELTDGRTLKQTNGNFMGVINSNDGFFRISARNLVSQYALLVANGYYKNEVTGETTTEDLTLFALTDVSARSKANVNLLTHLEYDRVYYLVTHNKVRFKDAKRRARAEIMQAFHIDTTGIGESEDLSVFGDSKGNAALLAISVMLQGRRSIAELTELLAAFSLDLEKDGTIGDSLAMAIADGIMMFQTKLPKIHANVEGWKLGDVPEFEPIVKNFMTAIYGIGNCSASDEGRIVQMQNAYSEFNGYYFVCEDENWRIKMYDSKTERYYRVAFIGSQVWMAEDYGIPDLENPGQLKYSIPAVEISDSASIVNGGVNQGICPDGWHLPTFDEWEQQLDYVWTEKTLEEAISASSWYGSHGINVPGNIDARLITTEGNDFGTDDYDFSAEPNRNYFASSVCYDTGSSESEYLRVCYRMFNTWNMKHNTTYSYITYAVYSVRCVKD
ncbi:MAG: hypothetical protein IKZ45_06720 [Fibrobacter sp.]|nr:hypothetical protein [Fibrobacter sp.]